VSDYKKLRVWRKAHALALNVHRMGSRLRGNAHASLRSQMVRAAMSIPTNIVEGREQTSDAVFGRFLRIALGSASELDYHLMTGRDLGAIPQSDYLSLLSQVIEVRMLLQGLIRRVDAATPKKSAPQGAVAEQ